MRDVRQAGPPQACVATKTADPCAIAFAESQNAEQVTRGVRHVGGEVV